MKKYSTPISILIGSMVIGLSIYFGLTYEVRADFKQCIKNFTAKYSDMDNKQIIKLCENLRVLNK